MFRNEGNTFDRITLPVSLSYDINTIYVTIPNRYKTIDTIKIIYTFPPFLNDVRVLFSYFDFDADAFYFE